MDAGPLDEIGSDAPPPRRRRLLTMGDCDVLEIGRRLSWAYEHTHIGDATWPSLVGEPVQLVRPPQEAIFEPIRRFIRRETAKTTARSVRDGGYDIIVTSVGAHLLNGFVIDGERWMADFTSEHFLPPGSYGGHRKPDIREYLGPHIRLVDWSTPDFADFLRQSFERVYADLFKPLIEGGAQIVLYRHDLATQALTSSGLEVEPDEGHERRGRLIEEVTAFAAAFPGVSVLEGSPAFNLTSIDAAGGRWLFHPIDEQYVYLAARLAELAGDRLSGSLVQRYMLENRQAWVTRTHEARGHDAQLSNEIMRLKDRERDLTAVSQSLAYKAARLEVELIHMRRSFAWRLTKPLRRVGAKLRFPRLKRSAVAKAP